MMKQTSLAIRGGIILLASLVSANASAIDLIDAYRAGFEHDSNFLAARASREEYEAGVPAARAALLPQLSYTYQRNRSETTTHYLKSNTADIDSGQYGSSSSSWSLRQALFRMPAWEALNGAQAQAEAADATLRKERQDLGLRIGSAYLGIFPAREVVLLAQSYTRSYEGLLALAERSFATGRGTRTDVEDARSRRDLAKAQESDANAKLSTALREFENITGLDAKSVPELDLQLLKPDLMLVGGREEWITRVADSNPEVQSLAKQLEAAQAGAAQARAGHLPTIDLVAAHQKNESDTNTTIGTTYKTNYIGIQVTVPLISGGSVLAQTRQASAREERVRQVLETTRRKTRSDAALVYDSIVQGYEQVVALNQAVSSGEQAVIGDKKGFQAGTRTIVDALDSESRLFGVKKDRAFALMSLANNRLKLLGLADSIDEDAIQTVSAWLTNAKK